MYKFEALFTCKTLQTTASQHQPQQRRPQNRPILPKTKPNQIQELEAEAAALTDKGAAAAAAAAAVAAATADGSATPTKVLRRERERLAELNARARDQKCALVGAATAGGKLPVLLLLNLARRDNEKPQLLPAMAVAVVGGEEDTPMAAAIRAANAELVNGGGGGGGKGERDAAEEEAAADASEDGGEEGDGKGQQGAGGGAAGRPGGGKPAPALSRPLLFCLGADNRMMVVSASHVVGVCGDEGLTGELAAQHAPTWAALARGWRAAVEDVRAWRNYSGGAVVLFFGQAVLSFLLLAVS